MRMTTSIESPSLEAATKVARHLLENKAKQNPKITTAWLYWGKDIPRGKDGNPVFHLSFGVQPIPVKHPITSGKRIDLPK